VRITVLAGGLGGSRCVHALSLAAGPEHVTAIGNVGDDLEMWDLHVSPDLDTIMYTLAGLSTRSADGAFAATRTRRWQLPSRRGGRRGSRSATATSGSTFPDEAHEEG
jgi:LPPG:FO 2-phospho-L-lactate transferase